MQDLSHNLHKPSQALTAFVGEGLSDDCLEALIGAVELSLPTAEGAALLGKICNLRRFGMQWMMVGSGAKASVERVLRHAAAQPMASPSVEEVAAAAKGYGISL